MHGGLASFLLYFCLMTIQCHICVVIKYELIIGKKRILKNTVTNKISLTFPSSLFHIKTNSHKTSINSALIYIIFSQCLWTCYKDPMYSRYHSNKVLFIAFTAFGRQMQVIYIDLIYTSEQLRVKGLVQEPRNDSLSTSFWSVVQRLNHWPTAALSNE